MSLAIDSVCLQCLLHRYLEIARNLGDEKATMAFARDLMQLIASAPEGKSSPWFGPHATALLQKHYGLEQDRLREEKQRSNTFVMERLDRIYPMIHEAEDPVFAALQLAIQGNYLDFAALQGKVSYEQMDEMLYAAMDMKLDMDCYQSLCQQLAKGKRLLYLTDNAGEIVFDRLLAEQIYKKYPHLEITFCVRGGPIANDATREDAQVVGIPFPVIDNGNCVGGTELSLLSDEAKRAMDTADVILAKGMGNTETLLGCGYNIYYAFLIKCPRFVSHFQKPLMTPMFVKEK